MGDGRRTSLWGWRVLVAAIVLALIAGVGAALHATQAASRRGVTDRYVARLVPAAKFVATYTSQLLAREQNVASATLSSPAVPPAQFMADVRAFGFQASLLLDSRGRVLAVAPAAPKLIGQPLGARYAHLKAALAGRPTVSDVVRSAAESTPVVAFAAPYRTAAGLRVFSGAYAIRDTPLAAFLNDTTTLTNARLYLVDSKNIVVAANAAPVPGVMPLRARDAGLQAASAKRNVGDYRVGSRAYTFAKTKVPGTNWSLLMTAPRTAIYESVNGSRHWGPWLILAGLSALGGLAGGLALRLVEGRRRLRQANEQLGELARTDPLTGLPNRRYLTEQLSPLLANVRRQSFPLCVLMIDIDNFKRLNDSLGHQAGDLAIRHVASNLANAIREGDLLARWGGEEFLAVLPATTLSAAVLAAERLRSRVESTPVQLAAADGGSLIAMAISVGVAEASEDTLDELLRRADLGLYEAKSAGRNSVRVSH